MENTYKKSGVDIEAGYKAVELIKESVTSTHNKQTLSGIGGFGGLFDLGSLQYKHPILVSGTDGVGTKLKLAFITDNHRTIGQDCVAMCANDIVCSGAKPLFFLDYIAMDKIDPQKVSDIVSGIALACKEIGCALIGGETAEMPGFYKTNEYDVAGFCVGAVEKEDIIDGSQVKSGDILIGLPSSGVHSNGFSLIRRVFDFDNKKVDKAIIDELLVPTKLYINTILNLKSKVKINGICHITGGGFYENIPRMYAKGLTAKIETGSYKVPEVFETIRAHGNIDKKELYNVFNMGVGMVLAVDKGSADKAISEIKAMGEQPIMLGEIIMGDEGIILC